MTKRTVLIVLLVIAVSITLVPAGAQDAPAPQRIELEAADGWTLVANYYPPPEDATGDSGAPAVLLLHQVKETWYTLVPLLHEAGYGVLAPDMRGHGETGGRTTGALAEQDVQSWLDWLAEQPSIDPEHLNIAGASAGAMLALRGMAHDERVVTAVLLSPVLTYLEITTEDAIAAIDRRPVYLVSGQRDTDSAEIVKQLVTLSTGDVSVRLYGSSAHGTGLFMVEEDLAPSIVSWLDQHNR